MSEHWAHEDRATAAHPGWTLTNLGRHGRTYQLLGKLLGPFLGLQPAQGALPILRAAVDPEVAGGSYLGPDGLGGFKGWPTLETPRPQATDLETAARLWEISEELTGVRYPLPVVA